jgi:hypothetical protein
MWDGEAYESQSDALSRKKLYEEKGFEVGMFNEQGKFLLYTRREVKEIVIEGTAAV